MFLPVCFYGVNSLAWKKDGDTVIYADDAGRVKEIRCDFVGELTGLRFFINFEYLWLRESKTDTLEPLRYISNLSCLAVDGGEGDRFDSA